MATEVKTAAEDVQAQTGQQGQSGLYGATKETIGKATEAGYGVSTAAKAVPQAIKDAAAIQKTAAQQAQAGYQTAYGQARGALASQHRNALVAARQALAEAATRGMQRGRTMAGNLQTAGTLGKQAATTHAQMASQQGMEQAQLTLGAAEKQAATGAAMAGFEAAAMKEAAAAELGAREAFQNAILGEAEAQGTLHQMTQDAIDQALLDTEHYLTEIANAEADGGFEDGVNIGAAFLDKFSVPMDPSEKVTFASVFDRAMMNHPDSGPNTGLWSKNQAYDLAQALGAGEALRQMSRLSGWMATWATADGTQISLTPGTFGMILNKMITEGLTLDQLPPMHGAYNADGEPVGFFFAGEGMPPGGVTTAPLTQSAHWGV